MKALLSGSRLLVLSALLATGALVYALAEPLPSDGGSRLASRYVRPLELRPVGSVVFQAVESPGPTATPSPIVSVPAPTVTPWPTANSAPQATVTPFPTDIPLPSPTLTPTFVSPRRVQDRPLRVFIDPGHGGPEPGAVHVGPSGAVDLQEKDVNLDISVRLAALLEAAGFQVLLARTEDRADRKSVV